MANTLMSLLVSIGVDTSDLSKGLTGAEKDVKGLSTKMQSLGKNMMKTGSMMTLGLTLPIAAFGASSVKSAMEAESAVADLEAVLKSTGGVAGVTLDELLKNAAALQKVTKFSDEAVMSAQGMLLTFTNIGEDIFPQATMAALDMAEKFGMDASQASITLGKALNDPIAGVGALRRIGVQLTDQQEEQIKSFMAVGNVAAAQAIILKELQTEIGGVALAAGATTAGGMAQFTNQLDDMKEIIGNALIPVMIRLMDAITPLIASFSNASPGMQNAIIAFGAFLAAAGPLTTVIGGVTSAVGFLLPALTTLFTFITATAIPAIAAFVIANAAWIVPLLLVAATAYLVYLAFKNNFGGITTTVQQLWFIIQWVFNNIVNSIKNAITWVGNLVKSFATIKAPNLGMGAPAGMTMSASGRMVQKKALGGSVFAGTPYTVGEHGIETFVPRTNGTIIPAGKSGGKVQNITVNIQNPKREAVEEDIRKAMKNLNYLGAIE